MTVARALRNLIRSLARALGGDVVLTPHLGLHKAPAVHVAGKILGRSEVCEMWRIMGGV